ncbi:hypothetical protein HDU98_003168, partial [Podochytrium sp. JEL0797]
IPDALRIINSCDITNDIVDESIVTYTRSMTLSRRPESDLLSNLQLLLQNNVILERLHLFTHDLRKTANAAPNIFRFDVKLVPCARCGSCNRCLKHVSPLPAGKKVVYTNEGTLIGLEFFYQCSVRDCRARTYYSYHSKNSSSASPSANHDRFVNTWALDQKFFVSSPLTAFSMPLLRRFDASLLLGTSSFYGFAGVYNMEHGYLDAFRCGDQNSESGEDAPDQSDDVDDSQLYSALHEPHSRIPMYRKRLAEVWFRYRLLVMVSHPKLAPFMESGRDITTINLTCLQTLLLSMNGPLRTALQMYSANHRCEKPGCGTVGVVDGSAKFVRGICPERDCNHISDYNVSFTVGCLETPAPNSRFCKDHSTESDKRDLPKPVSKTSRARDCDNIDLVPLQGGKNAYHVFHCKEGRMRIMSESCLCDISVELLTAVLDKNLRDRICDAKGGWVVVASSKTATDGKSTAAQRMSSPGDCNTHKDDYKSNSKTAGTSAFLFPCMMMLDSFELARVESTSQIYWQLISHSLATGLVLDYVVFDDGCHLGPFRTKNLLAWKCSDGFPAQYGDQVEGLLKTVYVIDRMHEKGHVRAVCHATFSARNPLYTGL